MFKYNNGNIPNALSELFTPNSSNHSYNTRNKDKIRSAYILVDKLLMKNIDLTKISHYLTAMFVVFHEILMTLNYT